MDWEASLWQNYLLSKINERMIFPALRIKVHLINCVWTRIILWINVWPRRGVDEIYMWVYLENYITLVWVIFHLRKYFPSPRFLNLKFKNLMLKQWLVKRSACVKFYYVASNLWWFTSCFVRHSSRCELLVIKLLSRQDSLLLDVANLILSEIMRLKKFASG